MSTNWTSPASTPRPAGVARATNWLLFTVLLAGPTLSVAALVNAINHGSLSVLSPVQYLGAAVIFWSPLPFSIPAVLLEAHRDAALPRLRGPVGWLVRAIALMPYLMLSPKSQVRAEAAASVVGFIGALALAAPYLHR